MPWVSHQFSRRKDTLLTFTRVTLLGDAAHVIPPFTGTGVNLAMHDAYDLGSALEKIAFEGASVDEVLAGYENRILERAAVDSARCLHHQEAWYTGRPAATVINDIAEMFGWAK